MKIEWKITPRDKKLLWLLGCCVVLLVFYYAGIRPTYAELSALEIRKNQLLMQQEEMELRLSMKEADAKLAAENEIALQELRESFLEWKSSEQLDHYLTSIFLEQEMTMLDSTIRSPQLKEILPYLLSSRMEKYQEMKKAGELPPQTKYVYSAEASYTAVGTKEQALAVLDRLAEETGVRVDSFSISEVSQQVGTGEAARYETKQRLELKLIVYMCAAQ